MADFSVIAPNNEGAFLFETNIRVHLLRRLRSRSLDGVPSAPQHLCNTEHIELRIDAYKRSFFEDHNPSSLS